MHDTISNVGQIVLRIIPPYVIIFSAHLLADIAKIAQNPSGLRWVIARIIIWLHHLGIHNFDVPGFPKGLFSLATESQITRIHCCCMTSQFWGPGSLRYGRKRICEWFAVIPWCLIYSDACRNYGEDFLGQEKY